VEGTVCKDDVDVVWWFVL